MNAPGRRIVAGAVVQGAGHLATGRGCQDAFRVAAAPDGSALVLAVADGAGSRERSALGAHLAVDAACRHLLATPPPPADAGAADWRAWLDERSGAVLDGWSTAVRALLAADGRAAAGDPDGGGTGSGEQTLAATLAAAVLRPPWVVFLQVGDCFGAVLSRPDGHRGEVCRLALPAQRPADFLSTPGAGERAVTSVLYEPSLSGVVLATDGCAPLALDHPSVLGLPPEHGPVPSARFFQPLAAALRANGGDAQPLHALLSGPEAARSGDDLTVLCALAPGGGPWS
ncbi:protein phosphatase 2C domain-containing protein [Kitasatospora cineracea]|uniref:protein phosphatase 2C domain-containing protein n=1 Tax=Kitasatospora cineracea TaxID=88074 RepID=UPI003420030A